MLLLVDERKTFKLLNATEKEFTSLLYSLGSYAIEEAENLALFFKHTPYFIFYVSINSRNMNDCVINYDDVVHECDAIENMIIRMVKCKKMYIVYDCRVISHGSEISMNITPVANVELGVQANSLLRKIFIDDILKEI